MKKKINFLILCSMNFIFLSSCAENTSSTGNCDSDWWKENMNTEKIFNAKTCTEKWWKEHYDLAKEFRSRCKTVPNSFEKIDNCKNAYYALLSTAK